MSIVTDVQQLYQVHMSNSQNKCMWTHAWQVGSILFTAEAGEAYAKGDELGYFAFGGSTCIAIFQKDSVVVDEDIISNRSALPEAAQTLKKRGKKKHAVCLSLSELPAQNCVLRDVISDGQPHAHQVGSM